MSGEQSDDMSAADGHHQAGQRIASNAMLSEILLSNLDIRSLNSVRATSRVWDEICERISKRRKDIHSICYAYDFSANPSKQNMRVNPAVQLLHDHRLLGYKNMMLVDHLVDQFKNQQWSKPRTGFLFHGGVKSVPEMYSLFKKFLPPDCQLLAVQTGNGIVPCVYDENTKTFSSTEIQGRSQLITAVSYLLWPDLGFDVTFFDEDSTLSEFIPQPDGSHKKLKCIMIFTNECITRVARRAVYKSFEHVNDIFAAYKKRIAMGGIVVDNVFRFPADESSSSTSASDSCHRRKGKKFAGVAISGDKVQCASGVFDSESLEVMEQELIEFKQSLDFDADQFNRSCRTLGFLFACSGRGPVMFKETNAESGIINKVFPSVLFTGLYGDGEYGENFWPNIHSQGADLKLTEDEETGFWHFYTSVIVLIHIQS
jgi:hypothetical protein